MAWVRNQFIKAGAVKTSNLVAGILAATTAGRALFATNFFDDATVFAKFAAGSIAGSKLAAGVDSSNFIARGVLTYVSGGLGGSPDILVTIKLYKTDGITPLTRAVNLKVVGGSATSAWVNATKGTIIQTTATVQNIITDANGEFACTVNNSADETRSYYALPADNAQAPSQLCACQSNKLNLTWSA